MIEKIDLFENNQGGYTRHRIPGIVVTRKGTTLAYCEGRKTQGWDWDTIDILMRRSEDYGRTWEPIRRIAHLGAPVPRNPVTAEQNLATPANKTVNNPVAIVDQRDGSIHFLYCVEYMRCFYMRSTDEGKTFSEPVDITATFDAFRSDYPWRVIATGPAHGIQLKNGRLVVPVWLSTATGHNAHEPSVAATIYSDDGGVTWKRGDIALPDTAKWVSPNETVVVQLADGRVMLNARTLSNEHRRLVTVSPDGATGWTTPHFDEALLDPFCMGSIVRLSAQPNSPRNRILFANPHSLRPPDTPPKGPNPKDMRARENVSIKLSYDEGQTWPVNKTLEPGWSSYSDLAVAPDGTILCLYERAANSGQDTGTNSQRRGVISVARFNLEWLTDGADSMEGVRASR